MLCVAMLSGCASAGRTVVATGPQPGVVDTAAMADYVQRIPAGSKVKVERTDVTSLRGTLMKASGEGIVVQKNTRIPEAPVEIPIARIARVTTEGGGGMSTGKAIGIGIASGVGAFFAILAILAASFND
jgi:hypothetical protein